MRKIFILLFLTAGLTLTSCGEKHIAKNTIKEFLKASIANDTDGEQADYDINSFGDIDSTKYVTEGLINTMHANADKDKNFKSTILYWKPTEGEQLKYINVDITVNDNDTTYTFYLTNDMLKVVAFK